VPEPTAPRLGGGFALLWGSSTASALGSGLLTIAAPLLAATYTRDPVLVAGAAAVAWLPWLLFALPGGVLVDRVDRRRLMLLLVVVRAVALGLFAVAVATGASGVLLLYAVLFVGDACEIVMRSASQALVPEVVPRSLLERANGWLVGGTTLTQQLLAGPLGGLLFVLAAALPFATGAGTYALSAVLLLLLGARTATGRPAPVAVGRSVRADVAEAFRWLLGQRLLRTMALLIGLLNLTLTAATGVLVLLAHERLGLGDVGYGLLFGAMAVGGLLGSALGDRIIGWATPTWTVRVGLLVEAGLHLVLATSRSPLVVGVAFLAFGVHGSLWSIVGASLRQRLTPPEMRGRVISSTLFLSAGGNCAGALLGGVAASAFGITAPYWAGFVVALAVSAATWRTFDRATVSAAYADPPRAGARSAERPEEHPADPGSRAQVAGTSTSISWPSVAPCNSSSSSPDQKLPGS
jgi:predicted MFS family arabinose efflux permease